MRAFAIDDEQAMLNELHDAIIAAEPSAEVFDFKRAKPALEAILEMGAPDIVFSDIELPGIDGIVLATQIKELAPDTKIIFVTAYPNYAVDAFRLHADGFVVKPVEAARIREEIGNMFQTRKEPEKLQVRCFGAFEVFARGKPLIFSRSRTKELLAYLVDLNGGTCTSPQIVSTLWEDDTGKNPQSYLRVLASDLRKTLESVGLEDVLVRAHGQWAIRTDLVECDYFLMLRGDDDAIRAFRGEYMSQYSWAEKTTAKLFFMKGE